MSDGISTGIPASCPVVFYSPTSDKRNLLREFPSKKQMSKKFALLLVIVGLIAAVDAGSDLTPAEIIQKFAEKESLFRDLWAKYTYRQTVVLEELGPGGRVIGRQTLKIEVFFNEKGVRDHRILRNKGRLETLTVTKEDIENAIGLQPFVLTKEELPEYHLDYLGKERVDELDTYVFDVRPKRLQKGRRYFKGKIWVDQVDLQIVQTRGKPVPEPGRQKFPEFETVRAQIDGDFWFPIWTGADDVLEFGRHRARLRQVVTYEDYQKFEVSTSISFGDPSKPEKDDP